MRRALLAAALILLGPALGRAQAPQTPAAIYRSNIARVFTLRAGNELGTGFTYATGRIATNAHVVGDATSVEVESQDGAKFQARVIRRDKARDFAILEYSGPVRAFATLVPLPRAATPAIGEGVVVIGSPLGSKGTVTTGIVSQIYPSGVIQLNAAINPGNSGGPVFDMQGRVFGIATAKFVPIDGGGAVDGLGVAIPIAWLEAR